MSEKKYCDVEGCGKEMKRSGLARYSGRQVDIEINGLPVRVVIYLWPHHNDVCVDCAEKIPALVAAEAVNLLQWGEVPDRNR